MLMLLAFLLMTVAALGPAVLLKQRRKRKLSRLQDLVDAGQKRAKGAVPERRWSVRHILPRSLRRNLHLLGFEPDFRGVSATLAAFFALTAATAMLFGILVAFALAAAFLALGLMALTILAARRLAELGGLLPSFFDRVRQLLIIGNSLPTAFMRSVAGAPPRLRHYFGPTVRRMGNGASFSESIAQCADDIDLYEMRLFAAAVATNMRFGGSLTHSLGNLVAYLRKRASIEREMRASTTQIRVSAWVLGALPVMVAGLIVVQNQDYAHWFIANPTGKRLLAYCVVSQFAGFLLMRLIVRTSF
jgi:tight adherence protein B